MAFDEIRFPLRVRYGAKGGPQFATDIVTIEGGYEKRNQRWSQARRRFDARTGVTSAADAALLLSFFCARAGRARGFRLRDWADYSSAGDGVSTPQAGDQVLGTGDSATVGFQLVKNYGGPSVLYRREIKKPMGSTVLIAVDGTAMTTGWSVDDTTGIVTFAQAPASGTTIAAGFLFDVPVRFDTDRLNLTALEANLEETEIPLIEVRGA